MASNDESEPSPFWIVWSVAIVLVVLGVFIVIRIRKRIIEDIRGYEHGMAVVAY